MRNTETHDYKYLPVTCPRCRAEGKVKIGRLDKTFICKQCKRHFHVDPDGVVSGDRLAPVDEEKAIEEALRPRRKGKLQKLWESIPRPAKTGIAGAILLLSVIVWQIYASGFMASEPLPEGLQERARYVAECLANADKQRVKKISADGTSGDASTWAVTKRPNDWPSAFTPAQAPSFGTKVAFESYEKKSAGVAVTISPKDGFTSTTLMLYFSLGSDQQWYFDGKRTNGEK